MMLSTSNATVLFADVELAARVERAEASLIEDRTVAVPAQRRRGVQTALLRRRPELAAESGRDIAVMTTSPCSESQQNGQRQGSDLLDSRTMLVCRAEEAGG